MQSLRNDKRGTTRLTKFMIPDVKRRCELPLELDHYTTQFLTGHRDFRSKLYSFKLQPSPNCACGNGAETVRHVLLSCTRTWTFRNELKITMAEEGEVWPPNSGAFLKTRRTYEALRTAFATEAIGRTYHGSGRSSTRPVHCIDSGCPG